MQSDEGQEELEALASIYGEDCSIDLEERSLQLYLPCRDACPRLVLSAHLPRDYPHAAPPVLELRAPYLSDSTVEWAAGQAEQMFVPGEVMMYTFIEWLKEQPHMFSYLAGEAARGSGQHVEEASATGRGKGGHGGREEHEGEEEGGEGGYGEDDERWAEAAGAAECSDADSRSKAGQASTSSRYDADEAAAVDAMEAKITSGQPFTERKSTFQAHVAPVHSHADVKAMVAALMRVNKIANATHNIMAYRIHVPEKQAFLQDCDDDGEAAAGGRLLHLLQVADARDVVVVVSRWFGGVLLGPSRFALINNTARQLLEQLGYVGSGRAGTGGQRGGGGGGAGGGLVGANEKKGGSSKAHKR